MRYVAIALLALTGGCSQPASVSPQRVELNAAIDRWRKFGSENYTYVRTFNGCFCPKELTQPIQVTIRKGRRIEPDPATPLLGDVSTIPEYFEMISKVLTSKKKPNLKVGYDPHDGHPLFIEWYRAPMFDDDRLIDVLRLHHDG
jgi:Family of unknown function (DUF6174)